MNSENVASSPKKVPMNSEASPKKVLQTPSTPKNKELQTPKSKDPLTDKIFAKLYGNRVSASRIPENDLDAALTEIQSNAGAVESGEKNKNSTASALPAETEISPLTIATATIVKVLDSTAITNSNKELTPSTPGTNQSKKKTVLISEVATYENPKRVESDVEMIVKPPPQRKGALKIAIPPAEGKPIAISGTLSGKLQTPASGTPSPLKRQLVLASTFAHAARAFKASTQMKQTFSSASGRSNTAAATDRGFNSITYYHFNEAMKWERIKHENVWLSTAAGKHKDRGNYIGSKTRTMMQLRSCNCVNNSVNSEPFQQHRLEEINRKRNRGLATSPKTPEERICDSRASSEWSGVDREEFLRENGS